MRYFRISHPLLTLIVSGGVTVAAGAEVSFNEDIRPIFSNTCFFCHGPDEEERKAGLRLDTFEGATADNDGIIGIVPGNPEASEIFYRLTTDDEDEIMPPPKHGEPFTPEEVALVRRWIEEGAKYETHWAYVKPERPELPRVEGEAPATDHPVDAFVLERLKEESLDFSPEADPATLVRRVAMDLTGLPPTPEEVKALVADPSPEAYARYVDELLARPTYGEHWARMWLDLARYADSAGYADDPSRTIWAYRDYVIRAFNENKSFDQFTLEQIAGDLLENPTKEQLVATAMHRNTQTNNEGGTSDEEFRNVAVVDRVNTTMATWMGTTMACAQCHTHKYDPITHEEYFQVFAIFNQTQDSDKRDESPVLPLFSQQQRARQAALQQEISALEKALHNPGSDPSAVAGLAEWEKGLAATTWHVLQPEELEAASGATLAAEPDGSVLAAGAKAETDEYTLAADSPIERITALRLELLADERLGAHAGPARTHNLVLNELSLTSEDGAGSLTRRGRYVRLEIPGKDRFLHVAEVQVFDAAGENNLARSGTATQSTTGHGGEAQHGIDGNTDGNFHAGTTTHTANFDISPWWEVDLGAEHDLSRIVVWNRTDNGLQPRLDGFRMTVFDAERRPVWEETFKKAPERELVAALAGAHVARFARASASYEQAKFGIEGAIDGDAGKDSGWAIAGGQGRDHHAVFELEQPISAARLRLRLQQNFPHHAIGRFRVSVTDATAPAAALPDEVVQLLAMPADQRDEATRLKLLGHYVKYSPEGIRKRDKVAALRHEIASIKPATTVPVLREVSEANRRRTHVHLRGSYLSEGPEVEPGLPSDLGPTPKLAEGQVPDRMLLARWLVDEDNPLTARVVANRFWEKLFGIGIVASSEEFGSQGELPSHPELLDWMAVELVESGWDMKAFLKILVTSRAYRQSSHVTDDMAVRDPLNRLLARGPRVRLSAEMVRDQALAVSGLLSSKMFGPPVKPPQPDLGLKAAFGSGIDWKTSAGEDRYRRGIYTTWRRSSPYPSMATFDAPNREVCVVRRDRTNTPLQALVTLNDPVYIEAAQALARRMVKAGDAIAERLRHGFSLCVGRLPQEAELKRLVTFYEETKARYAEDPDLAQAMATNPIGPAPEGSDHVELAALTVAGNVLLNLDEMLMKR